MSFLSTYADAVVAKATADVTAATLALDQARPLRDKLMALDRVVVAAQEPPEVGSRVYVADHPDVMYPYQMLQGLLNLGFVSAVNRGRWVKIRVDDAEDLPFYCRIGDEYIYIRNGGLGISTLLPGERCGITQSDLMNGDLYMRQGLLLVEVSMGGLYSGEEWTFEATIIEGGTTCEVIDRLLPEAQHSDTTFEYVAARTRTPTQYRARILPQSDLFIDRQPEVKPVRK